MRKLLIVCTFLLVLIGCQNTVKSGGSTVGNKNTEVANQFIDAFYSFNEDTLKSILSHAKESQPSILYYQKWAECGNYEIITRNDCIVKNDSMVICPITVKDDLIGALKIDFNVTDTFHLTVIEGQIRSVQTSSNDPDMYHKAKEWVKTNHPELIEEPCKGIWEGGPTPCDCVKAMVKGFAEYRASNTTEFQVKP